MPVSAKHVRAYMSLHVRCADSGKAFQVAGHVLPTDSAANRQRLKGRVRRAGVRGADPGHEGAHRPQRGGRRGVHLHRHAAPRCAAMHCAAPLPSGPPMKTAEGVVRVDADTAFVASAVTQVSVAARL